MKKLFLVMSVAALLAVGSSVSAYQVTFDFNTPWVGDYAPGWENTAYRHGAPPVGKMMEYSAGGMKLIADSTPEAWMWWAAVNPIDINDAAMAKAYDPYISADYYDEGWESGSLHSAGQIFAVPSWVNPYIPPGEDWTDVQFGARFTVGDNYYHVAAGEGSPGWQDTGVDRSNGWVNLKMQLSSIDGRIHFYINNVEKGVSYRDDYIDLGSEVGLYTMFTDPLSGWGDNKPSTIWDNFVAGSSYPVPEPGTMLLLAFGLVSLAGIRRKL